MGREKRLSKRQRAVIDDMFSGEMDEGAILEKHGIDRAVYEKWRTQLEFEAEFGRRIEWFSRHSEMIIAKYAPLAAAKLVALTESEKEETARHACLDIISFARSAEKSNEPEKDDGDAREIHLSDSTAMRLLNVLAEEK